MPMIRLRDDDGRLYGRLALVTLAVASAVLLLFPGVIYNLYGRTTPPQWAALSTAATCAEVERRLGAPAERKDAGAIWYRHHWWGYEKLLVVCDAGPDGQITATTPIFAVYESVDVVIASYDREVVVRPLMVHVRGNGEKPVPA